MCGKLVVHSGSALVLSDALSRLQVELHTPSTLELGPGQWLEVTGWLRAGQLCDASVSAVHPGAFAATGEFPRLSHSAPALRALASAKQWVRDDLRAQGFVEVTTPVRVPAPGTDLYIDPQAAGDDWLITSPEFHMKRLLAGGMPRIFQFAQCTRNEELGPWHQREFTMLEWYRGFASMQTVLQDTERLVNGLFEHLAPQRLASTAAGAPALPLPPHTRPPFERLTVREAFQRFANVDDAVALARDDEDRYFELMVEKVEPQLARSTQPVFLVEYPATQAALARRCAHDPSVAERFELYVSGVELCNGYGELTCPREQRARFERDAQLRAERGRPFIPIDESLLAAMHEGLPPCAGNAIGFERLVALALGVTLTDVIAFPQAR